MKTAINSLPHGGNIETARKIYGGSRNDWLDLSTGISPWHYPIPTLADGLWHELPGSAENLLKNAAHYYGCAQDMITVSPGSQLGIRLLPRLIKPRQSVAIPQLGYQEHRLSWQLAQHRIITYQDQTELAALIQNKQVDNAVIINPNNPTGEQIPPLTLLAMAENIAGIVVVDEAFADLSPHSSLLGSSLLESSLARKAGGDNIIVLRSIGKFFGLAGARVGFVVSSNPLVKKLQQLVSPWPINAASQYIAELALADIKWQEAQRDRVQQQADIIDHTLANWITQFSNVRLQCQGLFSTLFGPTSTIQSLHHELAERRVWTRLGEPHKHWLRLSLPGDHLDTLAKALCAINENQNSISV